MFQSHEFRMKRVMSLEKDLLQARKPIDEIKQKYSNKCRKLETVQSRYSLLRSKENKRQQNENAAGLDVGSKHHKAFAFSLPFLFSYLIEGNLFYLQRECKEILECLRIGRKNTQFFTEAIRIFSITLHFYSPRAYQFLRDKFNKNLPSVVTLRKWYANCTSEEDPGISKESLKTLAVLADKFKMQGKELVVSISFDEMSIRRMVQWNEAKKRFSGYITHRQFQTENIPVARNALVFLITGLNADFSLPLAHYFVIALKGSEKALLIDEVVKEVTNLKIRIANIAFDGLQSNITACTILDASFNMLNMKPYILNPINSDKIHILLDACHMLKVARNCIASEKFIHNRESKKK